MPIESLVGELMPETFTSTDRTELIKHGLELQNLGRSVDDLRLLLNATLNQMEADDKERQKTLKAQDAENEKRIRCLEDDRLRLETQLSIFKWIAGLAGPMVAGVIEVILHIFWK
jgi:DNA-binding transcriptional MerR regulator